MWQDTDTPIQEIKDRVRDFVHRRDWKQFHSPKNVAMSIAIEAAEIMEIFQWMTTDESRQMIDSAEYDHIKEELADVLIYCMSLANQLQIDVADAIESKLDRNETRFPVEEVKGSWDTGDR